jgi:hypothetical protein
LTVVINRIVETRMDSIHQHTLQQPTRRCRGRPIGSEPAARGVVVTHLLATRTACLENLPRTSQSKLPRGPTVSPLSGTHSRLSDPRLVVVVSYVVIGVPTNFSLLLLTYVCVCLCTTDGSGRLMDRYYPGGKTAGFGASPTSHSSTRITSEAGFGYTVRPWRIGLFMKAVHFNGWMERSADTRKLVC